MKKLAFLAALSLTAATAPLQHQGLTLAGARSQLCRPPAELPARVPRKTRAKRTARLTAARGVPAAKALPPRQRVAVLHRRPRASPELATASSCSPIGIAQPLTG
jgi:hypothetical protein